MSHYSKKKSYRCVVDSAKKDYHLPWGSNIRWEKYFPLHLAPKLEWPVLITMDLSASFRVSIVSVVWGFHIYMPVCNTDKKVSCSRLPFSKRLYTVKFD